MDKNIVVKHINNIKEIIAGDQCFLKELFHPDHDQAEIKFSLAYAHIKPGGKTLDHYLEQSETYYIISGEGNMHIEDHEFIVQPGNVYCVPPYKSQWIQNTGNTKLEFLVIVDPAWNKEKEYIK
jgi:mannose-6-phosphate isomerase-like protein (cupin superfamily)